MIRDEAFERFHQLVDRAIALEHAARRFEIADRGLRAIAVHFQTALIGVDARDCERVAGLLELHARLAEIGQRRREIAAHRARDAAAGQRAAELGGIVAIFQQRDRGVVIALGAGVIVLPDAHRAAAIEHACAERRIGAAGSASSEVSEASARAYSPARKSTIASR